MFRQFLRDVIDSVGITMVSLNAEELTTVIDTAASFALDFDDAYQYSIAEKYELTIVSFDSDFDRTTRGRRLPADLI